MLMLLPWSSFCSTDLKPGSPGYHAQNTANANPLECQVPCHCCYITGQSSTDSMWWKIRLPLLVGSMAHSQRRKEFIEDNPFR